MIQLRDYISSIVLILFGIAILIIRGWFPTLVAAERVADLPIMAVASFIGGLLLLWESTQEYKK